MSGRLRDSSPSTRPEEMNGFHSNPGYRNVFRFHCRPLSLPTHAFCHGADNAGFSVRNSSPLRNLPSLVKNGWNPHPLIPLPS